jgi:uroporphyrinogen-III decarboxylase
MAQRKIQGSISIPVEVQCEYAGIPQGEYYTDLEKAILVAQIYPARFEAAIGYRPPVSYGPPVIAYEGAAALGGDLVFPRDHQPMIANQGHVLETPEQVDALQPADPWRNARFQQHIAQLRELERRFPGQVSRSIAGQEGPITTAGLLRGQNFFLDCLADPACAHRLLDVVTETFIQWHLAAHQVAAATQVAGTRPQIAGIADDYAGLIRPEMWPEFVIPYYQRIIKALGPQGCHMHTELVRRAHLPYLRVLNLRHINFSEDQYLKPQDVFEELPGVPFDWHILTVGEMQQGTPESVRRRFTEIVGSGVDKVRCELTVNTPPQNVRAYLQVARELAA